MYEWMFWTWFAGACGCFAYDMVNLKDEVERENIVDFSMEAAIWPIAIFGTVFATAYIVGKRFIWNCRFL